MAAMKNSTPATDSNAFERQLREMNERLLVSSVRQHELTEQALKAEAAAAQLAAIVSSSGDAIISKDLQGIIRTFNKSAQRLTGFPMASSAVYPKRRCADLLKVRMMP